MKREEKNQQTKRRIMDGAVDEFSRRGYGLSSVNAICEAQNISKGIIYHYFDTKDDLYLACVEECFARLTEYLEKTAHLPEESTERQMENYFSARSGFFRENPVYQHIFCEAVLNPPAHLYREIQEKKKDFDALNTQVLENILKGIRLRPELTKEDVIETFQRFQDFINAGFQSERLSDQEFETHEEKCWKALNILLYGVVERRL